MNLIKCDLWDTNIITDLSVEYHWENEVFEDDISTILNKFAKEDWEFVQIVQTNQPSVYGIVFKRTKTDLVDK